MYFQGVLHLEFITNIESFKSLPVKCVMEKEIMFKMLGIGILESIYWVRSLLSYRGLGSCRIFTIMLMLRYEMVEEEKK